MYTYNFSDGQTEQISKKTKEYENLMSMFEGVDKKFDLSQTVNKEDYDKTLNLERKGINKKTDDEIAALAEGELFDYKTSSQTSIENNYEKNTQKIGESLEALEKNTNASKQNLEVALEDVKEKASNDAIKRGLARSSIIVNKLANFDKAYLNEFANIEKNFLQTQTKLNNEMSLLQVQKQNALDAFDIAYAVKLSEKINTINEKLLKQEQDVIEYNNKLEQIEKEFETKNQEARRKAELEAQKANMNYADFVTKNGEYALDALKEKEKYQIAKSYFDSLSKPEALFELENNSYFKNQLKSYYNVLLKEIGQKQN